MPGRRGSLLIERERLLVFLRRDTRGADCGSAGYVEALGRSVIELDRLSPAQLQREASEVGLRPEPTRRIPASEEHTGSAVVMLRA